jgi:hypothetical protein
MPGKPHHPFFLVAGLTLMATLACSVDINMGGSATQSSSPIPASSTPVTPSNTPVTPSSTPVTPSNTPVTPTPTDTPTKSPSPKPPTHTPTATTGLLFIKTLHFIEIKPPLSGFKLDYTLDPVFGGTNLTAGFTPDPFQVVLAGGGLVDTSYLGGACRGYTTAAPTSRLNFGGGGANLLRFVFIASGSQDAALVVNDPYGNMYCVDDSFGTVNPTIDFNNPAGGTYDIWVAASASGASIPGTLEFTGKPNIHP